jgi:glycosyltransferase involved in cell wall biosynthesis
MTASVERGPDQRTHRPLDAAWRVSAQAAQERALPQGSVLVSAPTRPGVGGLGRHLQEILEALDRKGQQSATIGEADLERLSPADGTYADRGLAAALRPLSSLARVSPSWQMWSASVRFDRAAAARLRAADSLVAFNGTALAQLRGAQRAGIQETVLMSANSHYRHVVRQHELAHRSHPVDRPWPGRLLERNLREYEEASRILVTSSYMRESFLDNGIDEQRLQLFPLTPAPRFAPPDSAEAPPAPGGSTFEILYIGSLMVHKGVPLLLEAFSRLEHPDLRLKLLGGWSTRRMHRFLERARAGDPRVEFGPGDPLAHLRAARLCVHPSYEDGFAYAPAEALAAGVPVIASEDTGMKELIEPGRTGVVLPTGDASALSEAIEAAYHGRLLGG